MSEEKFSVIRQYEKGTKRRRTWKKVVGVLACAVVFCTVYALILPAVAVDYKCGMEEHSHSPACYRQLDTGSNRRLTCTPGSLGIHSHDGSCYDGEGNLICGYADYVLHTHDANCYDDQGNLVCPFPEIAEDWDPETGEGAALHTHTSDCYDENGQLVCGMLETYEHTHGSHCFTEEQPPLTCTIPEGEGHTHTAACYGDWELVCGLPEHTHTADCCKIPESTEPSVTENATVPPEKTEPSATEDATVPPETTEPSATEDATVPTDTTEPSATEDATVPPDATEPAVTEDATVPTDTTEPSVAGDPTEPTDDRVVLPGGSGEPIDLTGYIESAILRYKVPQDSEWKEITGAVIPGDAELGLQVTYANVPASLLLEHGGQLTYTLPSLLRNPTAEGTIKDAAGQEIGTITLSGHELLMTFDSAWLEKQNTGDNTTVLGDFRVKSNINIAQIPDGGKETLEFGNIKLEVNFEDHLLANYGDVSVTKASSPRVICENGKDYLEYTLKLTAGPDGCLNVEAVDQFTANGKYAGYDNVTGTPKELTGEGSPRETIWKGRAHGSISTDAQTLIWNVGDMAPNEERTLTYRVQLQEGYTKLQNGDQKAIQNTVNAYSGENIKSTSVVNFEPKAGLNMNKSHGTAVQNEQDDSYTLTYQVWIEAYGDNNFPLTNVQIVDSLAHPRKPTSQAALPYISYVDDSFHLYRGKNTAAPEVSLNKPGSELPRVEYTDGEKAFTLYVGDMNAGDVYCLEYQVRVDLKAFAAVSQESLDIHNRAIAKADNAVNSKLQEGLQAYSTDATLGYDHWVQKTAGSRLPEAETISMTGPCYDATGATPVPDANPSNPYTVPAGSYRYTVIVNDRGDWDVSKATFHDQLNSVHMQYTGYVRVDAYTPKGETNKVPTEPLDTRWVKVDGLSEFQFTMEQIGFANVPYAYQLTYYGAPVDTGSVSQEVVTNDFTLSGKVILGTDEMNLSGVKTEASVTIQGGHSFEARKHPWYYEGAKNSKGPWSKGALYWVIQADGTKVSAGTCLKDQLKQNSQMVFHDDSLVGVYKGSFPDGESFTSYGNLTAVLDSNCLTAIPDSDYTVSCLKDALTVQMTNTVELSEGQSLYIVVKAEPTVLPTANREWKTYTNYLYSSDDGTYWVERDTADKNLYGGENILKELGDVVAFDGSQMKVIKDGPGEILQECLKEKGTYVAWAVKVNYGGELSGRYRVVDTIPDGMEVAVARLKWRGKHTVQDTGMCRISNLDGWTEHTVTAGTDNVGSVTSYYYTKGNQVLWEVEPLIAGNVRDEYSVDFQVVCRVTDPQVLLGGQEKTFNNQVVLQTTAGEVLDSDVNGVAIRTSTMAKKADLTGEATIPFTVTVNPLGEDLVPDSDTITLVDEMSETLRLDTDSIHVVDANKQAVDFTPSMKDNVLRIIIPDGQKLTVSYTAEVVAAPGQAVTISNRAHWEGYAASDDSSVTKENYSYSVGGTAGSEESPMITVRKIDENDLTICLEGAEFRLEKGTVDGSGNFTPDPNERPIERVTDKNGIVVFGGKISLLEYNTVYRITETEAPAGYVLDSTPHCVVIAKPNPDGKYPPYPSGVTVCYKSPNYVLSVENRKGEAYVEKKFQDINGKPVTQIKGTYRFGLYDKPEATGKPLQTVELVFDGTTQAPRGTFVNLDLGRPYYIYELDDAGNPITRTNQAMVDSRPFAVTYSSSSGTGIGSQVQANGTVTVTNQLLTESLPMTGGPGTFLYTAAGLMLLCGGTWLWYRKVRNGREMC